MQSPGKGSASLGHRRGVAHGMGPAEGAQVEMKLLRVQVKPHSLSFSPLCPFSAGPLLL